MNNQEVAHIWASQSSDQAEGSNFYFKGNTLYSYGSHFPIAVIHGDHVLFTTKDYSVTTSKHKRYARSAVSHKTVIYSKRVVPQGLTQHRENLDDMMASIFDLSLKHKRARKFAYNCEIENTIQGMRDYHTLFKIRPLKRHIDIMEDFSIEDAGEKRAEVLAKEKAKEARKNRAAMKEAEIDILLWKANRNSSFPWIPQTESATFLRISEDGKEIETSRGAKVPVIEAKALYIILKAGKFDKLIGRRIGYYTINKADAKKVVVGCHDIAVSEIDRVLKTA